MRKRDFRNVVIVILCFVVVSMSVGFAYLQSDEKTNEKSKNILSASWNVEISSVQACNSEMAEIDDECKAPVGNASNIVEGTKIDEFDKNKVLLSANLTAPGDQITYRIVISNKGTLPAKVANVIFDKSSTETSPLTFAYLNISQDDVIEATSNAENPTNKIFYVTVDYDNLGAGETSEVSMTNNLSVNFIQAN